MKLEYRIQQELAKVLHQEELFWFQCSRARWVIDGNRNTCYYHIKATQRRRNNRIVMIKKDEGDWVEDEYQIGNLFKNFYHKLFTKDTLTGEWNDTKHFYPKFKYDLIHSLEDKVSFEEI